MKKYLLIILIFLDACVLSQKKDSDTTEISVVAEGDSWFSYSWIGYKFSPDLIDVLDEKKYPHKFEKTKYVSYKILDLAHAGDELSAMVGKGEFDEKVKKKTPEILIFSGGGNDILDKENLESILKSEDKKCLDKSNLDCYINKEVFESRLLVLKNYLKIIADRTRGNIFINKEKFDKHFLEKHFETVPLFIHGYDYIIPREKTNACPNLERLKFIFNGLNCTWVHPVLIKKGITDIQLQKKITSCLIDKYNDMLYDLSVDNEYLFKIHYVDLRSTLTTESDWKDEIHPNGKSFEKLAEKFHSKITTTIDVILANRVNLTQAIKSEKTKAKYNHSSCITLSYENDILEKPSKNAMK